MSEINNIKFINTIRLVWNQFYQDGCLNKAASLAYTSLLCLVPLLTVSFSVFSAFPVFKSLSAKVQQLILENLVATAAQTIQQYLQIFINQTAKLPVIGMIALLVAAVLLVISMEQAFNSIWRISKHRHGVIAFLLYWAVITLMPIVLAAVIVIIGYISALPWPTSLQLTFITKMLALCSPYIALFLVFTLLYIALPNCKVPTKSAVIAALVVTLLFELMRDIFTWFIINVASYQLIYGALAIIPIFLVWLYISWVVILFGVVISHILTLIKEGGSEHCNAQPS